MAKEKNFDGGRASSYRNYYYNKYYNLFCDSYIWEGISYRAKEFLMRKFWASGTIGAIKIPFVETNDALIFTPYVAQSYDLYDNVETVRPIRNRGNTIVPEKTFVVDKDIVLGYAQTNRKPIVTVVDYYIDRIVNVELVLNTNLNLQKMPFLIPVEKEDKQKVKDIVDRILNNDICITVEDVDPAFFKAVLTEAPYLVDKLHQYKMSLENELKTILGINNQGMEKTEQLQLAEVNANNAEINIHACGYLDNFQKFCERVQETLGISISVKSAVEPAEFDGQVHDGDKPGEDKQEDEVEE